MTQLFNLAERHRRDADTRKTEAEANQATLRRYLYAADIPQAYKAYQRNNIPQVQQLLARHVPWQGEEDLRGFAWHFLDHLGHAELRTLRGHDGDVYTALYSPDGKTLATCGQDGTIRLWDPTSARPLATITGHAKEVNCLTFAPDGGTLVSADEDGVICLTDVADAVSAIAAAERPAMSLAATRAFELGSPVRAIAVSPDGNTLAAAGVAHAVELLPLQPGGEQRTLATPGGVSTVMFSRDGQRLLAATDKAVRQWRVASGEELPASTPGPDHIATLTLSHDGRLLVSADHRGRIKFCHGETLAALFEWQQADRVDALVFSADDQTLAIGGKDRAVELWDVASRTKTLTLRGHTGSIWSADFSPDGATLVTASADGTARLWDAHGTNPRRLVSDTDGSFTAVAFSPDSRLLAAGKSTGQIELWDWRLGRRLNAWQADARIGDARQHETNPIAVVALAYSPDGRQLASSHNDGCVRLWNAATGICEVEFTGQHEGGLSLSYAPDGRTLAVGASMRYSCARFWDLGQRQPGVANCQFYGAEWVHYLEAAPLLVACRRFSGSLRLLSTADLSQQAYLQVPPEKCHAIDVTGDGSLVATGGSTVDRGVYVWETATGRCLMTLVGHQDQVNSLDFGPDRRTLASASHDGTLRLWNLSAGQELLTFELSDSGAASICEFSPNGEALVATVTKGKGELVVWSAGIPTATQRTASDVLSRHEFTPGAKSLETRAAVTVELLPERRNQESGWFVDHVHWTVEPAKQSKARTALPTFEERTREGVVEHGAILFPKGSGAEVWTGVCAPLDGVAVDTRQLLRVANSDVELPNQAAAAFVVGEAWLVVPRSWTLILLPESVVQRQAIPVRDIGPTDDLFERFRRVHRWARIHGFAGGFPTFNDGETNGAPACGVVLIKPAMGEEMWIPVTESHP